MMSPFMNPLAPTILSFLVLLDFSGRQQAAKEAGEKAIANVRTQKSYKTKFKAQINIPNSDTMLLEGETLWVSPGVLYIHYKGSGQDEKRIVRVGDKVWIYHDFTESWVTSEEMGNPGAGRGVQNPDEVLGVLSRHLENAKAGESERVGTRDCGVITLSLAGGDIEKIMKEQASQGSFDYPHSKADVKLWTAGDLVYKFASSAELVSTDPNIKGKKVTYSAEVEVTGYGAETEMKFTIADEKTRRTSELKLADVIQKAISELQKKKP